MEQEEPPNRVAAFLAALVVRYLYVPGAFAAQGHRGPTLILVVTAAALATALFAAYLLVSESIIPGGLPPHAARLFVALGVTLLGDIAAIFLARRGWIMAAGTLWLAGITLPGIWVAMHDFDLLAQPMMMALLVSVFAAGLLIRPIWGLLLSVVIAILDLGLALALRPPIAHDVLASSIVVTLLCGLVIWLFASSLEGAIYESDALRQEAERQRDFGLDLSRQHAEQLKQAGHDLRTRIELALGYVGFLEHRAGLGEDGREALEAIRGNLREMTRQAQSLLQTSHLQGLATRQRFMPFSPSHLLVSVITDYAPLAEHKGLRFQVFFSPEVPDQVTGDPLGFRHALGSVLSNAIRYTPRGEIRVRAWLPDVEHWAICVSDTGVGIQTAALSRIVEPFYRVAPSISSSHYGLGMGLPLARELVESMGGEFAIKSDPDSGTQVTMTLPLEYLPAI